MTTVARHELVHPDGRRLWIYGDLRGSLPSAPGGAGPDADAASRALHQRYDALTDSWIAVSPARNVRPHTAGSARPDPAGAASPAPACPLCPGGPEVPFSYEAAVFENRWPSLVASPPPVPDPSDPWQARSLGRCEVILYTPAHLGSLATLEPAELARVIAVWVDRSTSAWADPTLVYVMAFENRGAEVGATIGHPHGQLYAFDRLPPVIERRMTSLARHRSRHGSCLTCAVVERDAAAAGRLVDGSAEFLVAVPFAPRWPYEVHVRARRHGVGRLADLDAAARRELAGLLRRVVVRFDRLFGFELPYMMTILEAPADAPDHHLVVEFLPPQRSAGLVKVRASVETATGLFINDTLPEVSAAALRRITVDEREEAPAAEAVPTP